MTLHVQERLSYSDHRRNTSLDIGVLCSGAITRVTVCIATGTCPDRRVVGSALGAMTGYGIVDRTMCYGVLILLILLCECCVTHYRFCAYLACVRYTGVCYYQGVTTIFLAVTSRSCSIRVDYCCCNL